MIDDCIAYLETILAAVGVQRIYSEAAAGSAHKGGDYALILTQENERTEYDGGKVACRDDFIAGIRTYHVRRYKVNLTLTVRLVGRNDQTLQVLKDAFLTAVGAAFADRRDYRVDVAVTAARWIKDKSILASGAGCELDVAFSGGAYVKKEIKLLTGLVIEGKITKGGEENDGDENTGDAGADGGPTVCY